MSGDTCDSADENPGCPYLSEIHQQGKDIMAIKNALIGEDMQGGMVAEIQKFKILWKVTIFISGVSITGFITLVLKLVLHI
jgi:hypothetical protein